MNRIFIPLILAVCTILSGTASYSAEVKLNFTVTSGGGIGASTMYTSASGIDGNFYWESKQGSWPEYASPGAYDLSNIVDGNPGPNGYNYWLTAPASYPTEYLKVVFPESIYLTKIRTYNIADMNYYYSTNSKRWMESNLWISTDGVNFTNFGSIGVDANPDEPDFVDIAINDSVRAIEYRSFVTNPAHYYGMGEVEFYTDDQPPIPAAIPEPASLALIALGIAGLLKRKPRS
ncbi:MAG: discoidin domain-containing protein [Candidatus Auribacterota bacterium]